MRTPLLQTRSLRLMPFDEQHLTARYVGWLNDPEVVRYSEQRHRRHTLDSCRRYYREMAEANVYFWAIEAIDPPLGHVGNLTATIDEPNRVADLAIMIGEKSAWGRGLGREAWAEACRFLLAVRGLRKVSAGTMAANHGMRAIMRRTGMVEECRRPRHLLLEEAEMDLVYAGLYVWPVGLEDRT